MFQKEDWLNEELTLLKSGFKRTISAIQYEPLYWKGLVKTPSWKRLIWNNKL